MTTAAPGRRIGSLDGLRAIAILLVLADHGLHSPGLPAWLAGVRWFVATAGFSGFGVRLFFVISGFIITHLMLREEQAAGGVSLRQFWIRRALRILPPLGAYMLAVLAVAHRVPAVHPQPVEYAMAATFTWGILSSRASWYLGHTWSLSIEEQFYLLWPCVLALVHRRRLALLAAAFALLLPAAALAAQALWPQRAAWLLPASGCYLAAGCGLALLRMGQGPLIQAANRSPWPLLAACLAMALLLPPLAGRVLPAAAAVMTHLPAALGLALLVNAALESKGGAARLLNLRPVMMLGLLSYSLYIWQQLFLGEFGTEPWQAFPLNVPALFLAATLSYFLLERPFMRLRQRLHRANA